MNSENPLVRECQRLYDEGLPISSVVVCQAGEPGRWRASIGINMMIPHREAGDDPLPHHKITIDDKDLPAGVSLMSWTRYPDQHLMLSGSEEVIEAIVDELAREGQAIDWAQINGDFHTKPNRWLRGVMKRIWEDRRR